MKKLISTILISVLAFCCQDAAAKTFNSNLFYIPLPDYLVDMSGFYCAMSGLDSDKVSYLVDSSEGNISMMTLIGSNNFKKDLEIAADEFIQKQRKNYSSIYIDESQSNMDTKVVIKAKNYEVSMCTVLMTDKNKTQVATIQLVYKNEYSSKAERIIEDYLNLASVRTES